MSSSIAVVGISTALPSGKFCDENFDHRTFFDFLLRGGESYEPLPTARFDIEPWLGKDLGQISVQQGSFLKGIDLFDYTEFGVSSRDARAMAPATRLLIEQTFCALLDSGIDYRGRRVGCYMSANPVELSTVTSPDEYEPRGSFARAAAMVANRVSLHLDLLGPSVPVDTACSSSQTAFHLAVQSIIHGDCEAAVVGGCQLNHRLHDWIEYSQTGVLAPDGKCKPFDASADGFGRAEGCVVVVLKPLDNALRDNDRVYAVVQGTSTNNNGAGGPPAAPVAEYQADAMKAAFMRAGRTPNEVSYIEVHATGTAKGDPTEVNWVGEHFRRDDELLIGSVKGNTGHTEITAFLASLSKVLSIFEHKIIPPNVNLSTLNPAIRWKEYNLRVPTSATPLPGARGSGGVLISMSSSGIGGSNGHVVLEAPPEIPAQTISRPDQIQMRSVLIVSGGLSPRSAATLSEHAAAMLRTASPVEWPGLATVLGRRTKQMSWRSFALALPHVPEPVLFSKPQHSARGVNSMVFVFSGQGPQHEAMGRELFDAFPVFRESILEMDAVFTRVVGESIIHDYGLFGPASSSTFKFPSIWPIALTLPAISMFQIAFFDLLVHLGVKPDIVLGHSAGETAVLYASGAAPKAMVVELAIIRGRVFSPLESTRGTMAALSCTPEDAKVLIAEHKAVDPRVAVEIACLNAPTAVAISGMETAIDAILARAQEAGIFARKIRTRMPIHSSMMDACRTQYLDAMRDLFERYPGAHIPTVKTYSTLSGLIFDEPFDAEYFWKNTREQVLFAPVIQSLGDASTFVEIAPHPVLSSYLSTMASDSSIVLSTVFRPNTKSDKPASEYRDVLQFLGKLTVAGHNCVDFTALNGAQCTELKRAPPVYPFLKKQFPLYPNTITKEVFHGPLNRSRLKLNRETHSTFAEHVIRGEPIWPAAGFLEMALEFGATTLFAVNVRSMLSLSSDAPLAVNITLDGSFWSVTSTVPNRPGKKSSDNKLHADGFLSFEAPPKCEALNIPEIRSRCTSHVDADFYPSLSYFSTYGPKFQRLTNLYYNADEALASIRGTDGSLSKEESLISHPAIIDAIFHVAAYRPFTGDFAPNNYYLPSRIVEMILHQPPKQRYFPAHIYAYVQVKRWTPGMMAYSAIVTDDLGTALCTIDFEAARHHMGPLPPVSLPFHTKLQPAFPSVRPPISTLPPKTSKSEELVPTTDVVASAIACSLRLQRAISLLATTGCQHAMRICILSDAHPFIARLTAILAEYPSVAFELSIPIAASSFEPIPHPCTVVRYFQDIPSVVGGFDIVVSSGWTSNPEFNPYSILRDCDNALLPGGTLLLAITKSESEIPRSLREPECESVLHSFGYSFISDSLHLVIDAQKATWSSEQTGTLFNEGLDFVFDYAVGDEGQLQWYFTGLNPSQELQIWIVATEGPDAAAGMGFTRALRREYLYWEIRFVSFPESVFPAEKRKTYLASLPAFMKAEPDIAFSASGEPLVPRLVPLVVSAQPPTPPKSPSAHFNLGVDEAAVTIRRSIEYPQFAVVLASVIQPHPDILGCPPGTLLVGLQRRNAHDRAVVSLESMCAIPVEISFAPSELNAIPGMLTAVFALPALRASKGLSRSKPLSILVTHSDSPIGSIVCDIYSREGLPFVQTAAAATLLDLSRLGREAFDVVISGYNDKTHVQVLRTLLHPLTGKLFEWNKELCRALQQDPCTVSYALHLALSRGYHHTHAPMQPIPASIPANSVSGESAKEPGGVAFSADKTYILLGGIGNIGAHIALYMVERGARHLVVTSRSGEKSLARADAVIVRRIFKYLQSLDFLDLRLLAVDAACEQSMKELFSSIPDQVGGCVLLAAVQCDGLFPTLLESDFVSVFAAKTGVVDVLLRTTNVSVMDFVLGFSSVTSVFGAGGQTNYCAANAALEEGISRLPNGFSFICPAIIDSSFMHAGGNPSSRLNHLVDWAISEDELMLWLDDALTQFQAGARFHTYMPSMDWEALDRTHGMPRSGAHLVPSSEDTRDSPAESEPVVIQACRIIRNALNISDDDFNADVPLTSYGIDSLSAARLSFALRGLVQVTQLQLLGGNSVTDLISKCSTASSEVTTTTQAVAMGSATTAHHTLMEDLVRKYSEQLDAHEISPVIAAPSLSVHTVLLTGSTGALGSHLLAHLLTCDTVQHVYALNRTSTCGDTLIERQAKALAGQGLAPTLAGSTKLTLLVADLAEDDFGVSAEQMKELLSSVTHIIHNAWRVDFMAQLSKFEPLIAGTHRLLEFAIKSKRFLRPSLTFISSIGVSRNLPATVTCAPESPIEDARIAVETGYVESKWVAERLVQLASEKGYLDANVIRIGQLTGSESGAWNISHWVPALAQSGAYLGCLPDGHDVVSWLPMNVATSAIVEMQGAMNETFHLVHPRPTTWRTLMQPLAVLLGVPLVPYAEWFARLKGSADIAEGSLGALRLLDFFRQGLKPPPARESMGLFPKVAGSRGMRVSPSLQGENVAPLGALDVAKWVQYWRCVGFLPEMSSA